MARFDARRAELGEAEFSRQMMAEARDEATAVIKRVWVEDAIRRGAGLAPRRPGYLAHGGTRVYTGCDLAVQQHARADETALVTVAAQGDGNIVVIDVSAGRWDALQIVAKIRETCARFGSTLVIENVAAQDHLRQILAGTTSIPIIPHTTGRGKASLDFAIEQLAVRLGNGKIVLPSGDGRLDPATAALVREMLDYAPGSHVGDRLAGLCFALHGVGRGDHKASVGRLINNYPGRW